LGLARDLEHVFDVDLGEYGPLFVNAMYNQNLIDQRRFSFYVARHEQDRLSFIDFGQPQPQNMKNPDEIEYIKVLDDFFWSSYNQGVAIGTTDVENTFSYQSLPEYENYVVDNSLYTIFDSGSSAINFSTLYFEDFIKKIYEYLGGGNYKISNGVVQTQCYNGFPSLFFMFSGKWIEVNPKDYVLDISKKQDRSLCMLLILPSNTPMHVIGMPLMVDYYTVHDMDSGTIGFAPHSISSKQKLYSGGRPEQVLVSAQATQGFGDLKSIYNVWTQLICALIIAVAIIIYRYALYDVLFDRFNYWVSGIISFIFFFAFIAINSFIIVPFVGPIVSGQVNKEEIKEENANLYRTPQVGASESTQNFLLMTAAIGGVVYLGSKILKSKKQKTK